MASAGNKFTIKLPKHSSITYRYYGIWVKQVGYPKINQIKINGRNGELDSDSN